MAELSKAQKNSLDAMSEIFFGLCKRIDSPVSLACWLLYKYGEHEQLARKKVEPLHYHTMPSFREDYLVVSYLSKWQGLVTGLDLEGEALGGFAAAELKCLETNKRLKDALRGSFDPRVEPVITLAVRKIGDILGPLKYIKALEKCGWGKGATSTLSSEVANLVRKIDPAMGRISVTRRALPLLRIMMEADPCWASAVLKRDVAGPYTLLPTVFDVVEGNKVTTVPKDATKDRTIAAEPTGNIFLQLGVGKLLRSILRKRCGIDLDDQTNNQRYAKIGSETGRYATLDLKSASDTVSKELVKQLLPYEWFELLESLRSPKGRIEKGDWFEYEKFSSMGNGFTFELETLIFYALAVAVAQHLGCAGRVLVYGDDLIVPTEADQLLREVLLYCGFDVNPKKSYATGNFRESCGRHYWNGVDVTPIYQKEIFHQQEGKRKTRFLLEEGYRCANRLIRLALRRGHLRWLDAELEGAWRAARRVFGFESDIRHAVPLCSQDDDGLALALEELEHYYISASRHGMVKLPVLAFRPTRRKVPPMYQGALLAYWLRQSGGEVVKSESYSFLRLDDFADPVYSQPFEGKIAVRRRGYYVSRRRMYPRGTLNVAWL